MNCRPRWSLLLMPLCLGIVLPAAAANDPEASLPYCYVEVGAKQALLTRNNDPSSANATILKMNAIGDWKKEGTLKKGESTKLTPMSHYRICFDIDGKKRDMSFTLDMAASFTLTGYNIISKSKTLSVSNVTKGQETFQVKDDSIFLMD